MLLLTLLGCAEPPPLVAPAPDPFALRRLNRSEYQRTLRDLLGAEVPMATQLPPDDSAGGFDNAAAALATSPLHVELWEQIASAATQQLLARPLEAPVDVTVQAESDAVTGDGSNTAYAWGDESGFALWSNGLATWTWTPPMSGRYHLSARVRADAAGEEGANVDLQVNQVAVYGTSIPPDEAGWVVIGVDVPLPGSPVALAASFENDFYDEETGADRNVYVDWLRIEGPLDPLPPPNLTRAALFTCDPAAGTSTQRRTCAREIAQNVATRAWRRPVDEAELDRLLDLYDEADAGGDAAWGLELILRAVLTSPHFIYLVERPGPSGEVGPYELAARLSYFLWSSMPDDALRARAADGSLLEPHVLRAEVARMLRDPRATALTDDLAGQWLGVRMVEQATPDPWVYPEFNSILREAMVAEMRALFASFVGTDRSMRELLTSEWAWVDNTMADFYGVPFTHASGMHQVNLFSRHRGGWLSQAGLLMATSYPTRTSPVRRGVWVLGNLLCEEPDPPPAGVGAFPDPDADLSTVRARLEAHRRSPGCAVCHDTIDPLGLTFEAFDGVGAWRELDEDGLPVDATGALPDGPEVDGVQDLSAAIADDPRFAACVTEKVFAYAHHRTPTAADAPFLERVKADFLTGGMRLDALVAAIVSSPTFRARAEVPR